MLPTARIVIAGLGVAVIAIGCEAPLPETPPAREPGMVASADLYAEWLAIANTPPTQRDIEGAFALTSRMAATEGGLEPMVALLGDPSQPAGHKVLALMCLTSQRDKLGPYEAQLRGWVASGQPSEIRKFAAHALGLLDSAAALDTVETLLSDADQGVREAAMGVLLTFHPERITDRVRAFWSDPETTPAARDQVILGMPPHLVGQHIALYAEAVGDRTLSQPARLKAINVLGQLGSSEHIPVLEQCIESDSNAVVQEQARGALALLRVTADGETGAAAAE